MTLKNERQSTIVRAAKLLLLEYSCVFLVMIITNAYGLLHLEHHYELVTKGCLSVKDIVEVLLNRPFFIIVTSELIRPQQNWTNARF